MSRSLFALLVLSACARSTGPAPTGPAGDSAPLDTAVAMVVEVGGLVAAAGDDCAAMATALGAWLDRNGERRAANNAALARIDGPEARADYQRRLAAHLDVVAGLETGVAGCRDDARLAAAWKRFER